MAVSVYINRPPHNVHLHAWGRADTGWWGCITWRQRVRTPDGDHDVGFAAWVQAATLSRPSWSATEDVPPTQLPTESRSWPAPPGWPSWFAGVWLDGPVPIPPGVEIVSGPGWRDRHSSRRS